MPNPRGTYLEVAASIRKDLETEVLGNALPSEAELVREYGVARSTIRRALAVLESKGIVESVPGIGWRLRQGAPHVPLLARVRAVISEDSLAVGDAFPSEAKLCERFQASRTAVRRALAQMEGAGLLVTTHGKGRTVLATQRAG